MDNAGNKSKPAKIIETNSIKMPKTAEFNKKVYSQTYITIQKPPIKQRESEDQSFRNSTRHPKPNHLITATIVTSYTHLYIRPQMHYANALRP